MKCNLLKCSTVLTPGSERQLRLELVEQLELGTPVPNQELANCPVITSESVNIVNVLLVFKMSAESEFGFIKSAACWSLLPIH